MLQLIKANINNCSEIHNLQVKAFRKLLDKYNDFNTNPGAESVDKVIQRMSQPFTDYYFIRLNNINIGAIRIRNEVDVCTISPIFILPEYQGNGYARQTIIQVESLYPYTKVWNLATIKQEEKLCSLYESLGYKRTGTETRLHDNMTIIGYEKQLKL